MMKRVCRVFFISMFFILAFISNAYANDYTVDIVLNDNFVRFPDAQPFISNTDRTMVPIRFVAESFGINVEWLKETDEVVLEKHGLKIQFKTGTNVANLNGKEKILDTKTIVLNDRTYVPLRFISSVMGYDVNWIDGVKWAIIEETSMPVKFSKVAAQIVTAVDNCKNKIDVSGFEGLEDYDALNKTVKKVMDKISISEYENFYFNRYYTEITTIDDKLENFTVKLLSQYTEDEARNLKNNVRAKAENILSSLIKPQMSEYDKELAIHDYIIKNTKYDLDVSSDQIDRPSSYNIYGVIIDGLGVCEGYAKSMGYLLEKVGIKSELVTGTADGGDHAWNQVYIDNGWYNLDAAWNDPIPDKPGVVSYKYFNITDDEIKSNHWWNTNIYYACNNTKYNYYVKNKLYVTSQEGLLAFVYKAIKNKDTSFEVKAVDFMPDISEIRLLLNENTAGYKYYPVEITENNISYIKYMDIRYN